MIFAEWWRQQKAPEKHRDTAKAAWYAAIDQTIHQQQRNAESERDARLAKPLIEVLTEDE